MTDKANNITDSAIKTVSDSNSLKMANDLSVEQLSTDDIEARNLIEIGRKLRDNANRMYKMAKDASDQAKSAQKDGLEIAKEAQDMLTTLLVRAVSFI